MTDNEQMIEACDKALAANAALQDGNEGNRRELLQAARDVFQQRMWDEQAVKLLQGVAGLRKGAGY